MNMLCNSYYLIETEPLYLKIQTSNTFTVCKRAVQCPSCMCRQSNTQLRLHCFPLLLRPPGATFLPREGKPTCPRRAVQGTRAPSTPAATPSSPPSQAAPCSPGDSPQHHGWRVWVGFRGEEWCCVSVEMTGDRVTAGVLLRVPPLLIKWHREGIAARQASSSHNQSSCFWFVKSEVKKQMGRRGHCLIDTDTSNMTNKSTTNFLKKIS